MKAKQKYFSPPEEIEILDEAAKPLWVKFFKDRKSYSNAIITHYYEAIRIIAADISLKTGSDPDELLSYLGERVMKSMQTFDPEILPFLPFVRFIAKRSAITIYRHKHSHRQVIITEANSLYYVDSYFEKQKEKFAVKRDDILQLSVKEELSQIIKKAELTTAEQTAVDRMLQGGSMDLWSEQQGCNIKSVDNAHQRALLKLRQAAGVKKIRG